MIDIKEALKVNLAFQEGAIDYQKRKYPEWLENYMLYRDRIIYNRFTQRQSINAPIMKTTIRTVLKDIDDAPVLYFKCLDNDEQREIYFNKYWNQEVVQAGKLSVKDIMAKRNLLLYGRYFKFLNILNGKFNFTVPRTQDVRVDRLVDPSDIDTLQYLNIGNIWMSLDAIKNNDLFIKSTVNELVAAYGDSESLEEAEVADDEITSMDDAEDAIMRKNDVKNTKVGKTQFEVQFHYSYFDDADAGQPTLHIMMTTKDSKVLYFNSLHNFIGETSDNYWYNHVNLTTCADDVESGDFWSDSVADIVRQPNKVTNTFISQLIENRTLRSFGMMYYNSLLDKEKKFQPRSYIPEPFLWMAVPGEPGKNLMPAVIQPLTDSMNEINFLMNMTNNATAATATNQGGTQQQKVTLGEVQLAIANAQQRTKAISLFTAQEWQDFGIKFVKMMEAAGDMIDPVEITEKGRLGLRNYKQRISPKDWMSYNGWMVEVKNVSQDQQKNFDQLNIMKAIAGDFQGNQSFNKIYKKKELELAGLDAKEMNDILTEDEKNQKAQAALAQGGMNGMGAGGSMPALPSGIPNTSVPVNNPAMMAQ